MTNHLTATTSIQTTVTATNSIDVTNTAYVSTTVTVTSTTTSTLNLPAPPTDTVYPGHFDFPGSNYPYVGLIGSNVTSLAPSYGPGSNLIYDTATGYICGPGHLACFVSHGAENTFLTFQSPSTADTWPLVCQLGSGNLLSCTVNNVAVSFYTCPGHLYTYNTATPACSNAGLSPATFVSS